MAPGEGLQDQGWQRGQSLQGGALRAWRPQSNEPGIHRAMSVLQIGTVS